jgi:hypothetical protein
VVSTVNGNGSGPTSEELGSPPPATGTDVPVAGIVPQSGSMSELRRRRLELAEHVAALTWDLGGLAYEMAVRDHYRLDVLARKAAELQVVDAQLGEVQRLLANADAGIDGECRSCGAVHSRGRVLLALRRTAHVGGPPVGARRTSRDGLNLRPA